MTTDTTYCGHPRRSAYENVRADHYRELLWQLLGPVCAECGDDLRGQSWEINHIYGRDWIPRKLSRYRRNKRYYQEALEGLVNALCSPCNKEYRPKAKPTVAGVADEPF